MSNNYYKSDKCYEAIPTLSGQWLANNFYISTVSNVMDCESEALRYNSDFFFISDISISRALTDNNIYTNCYIPKLVNTRSLLTASAEILNIFNTMFKSNNNNFTDFYNNFTFITISNDLVDDRLRTNRDCFKWRTDGQVYTKNKNNKNYYAYYKKPILDEANLTIMKNLKSPDHYLGLDLDQTSTYDLLRIGTTATATNHGELVQNYIDFIVYLNDSTENNLNTSIRKLRDVYNNLESDLNAIKSDLSGINYINRLDDETLRAVNLNITNKTRELNSLLGSGGANNGRLDDTTLLTQFKIVENSILLLIIISAIFYFTSNKKLILAS